MAVQILRICLIKREDTLRIEYREIRKDFNNNSSFLIPHS